MTNKELRDHLQAYPDDMEVVLDGSDKMYLPIDTRDVFRANMFHLTE